MTFSANWAWTIKDQLVGNSIKIHTWSSLPVQEMSEAGKGTGGGSMEVCWLMEVDVYVCRTLSLSSYLYQRYRYCCLSDVFMV